MNEFQLTPGNILGRHSMNVSESAYLTRYDPTFLESILTGKSCQVLTSLYGSPTSSTLERERGTLWCARGRLG